MAKISGLLVQPEEKDKMDCLVTQIASQSSVELGEMPWEQERRRSKESISTDTSFQSVCGSLGTADVRRPSSATSYSISGNNLRHASTSSGIGAVAAGSRSGGVGSVASATGSGAAMKSQQGSQGSGVIPSLNKLGITEENQISVLTNDLSTEQLQRKESGTKRNGRLAAPTATSPVSGKLIHPGMEIFNYDTGRPPHEGHLTPPLQSPHYSGPKVVSSFNPTYAFFVTRTGTPGLSQTTGDHHKHHLLKSRGWEIRDVSGAIRRGLDASTNFQRAGTGGIGGKNAAAEYALESVTEEVFGLWGRWTDTGSHIPWRRSLDSSMLSATPSTSSFFSHFRTPITQSLAPRSPSLAPSSVNVRPSLDSRAGSLPGPRHIPPDPAYVSLKANPASSKSTFYSIETGPLISGDYKFANAKSSQLDAYKSETGRIPISQWKVPYSINSPSTITLLNYYDSHHNQQHGHKVKPQKSKEVEVWARESDLRTQFFEMDKSTYTWEFRVRPKMKVPIITVSPYSNSFIASPTSQSLRIPFPTSPIMPATPASIPSTPTGIPSSFLGGGSSFSQGVQKVVKYRSECLVLVKEVDGARYIVGEYYFLKSLKSTTVTPISATNRLRKFMSSPGTPEYSPSVQEPSPNQPPPTPSSLNSPSPSPSFKEKEKVQYTNIGRNQSGILLLDARGVNKVIALNSLLLTLKREKQRRIVTLNASSNGVRTRRWGYGLYDYDLAEDGDSKAKGQEGEGRKTRDVKDNQHESLGIGNLRDSRYPRGHDITISISLDEDDSVGGEAIRNERNANPELDVDDYNLYEDDWEYDETEGWKRRGRSMVRTSGGVG